MIHLFKLFTIIRYFINFINCANEDTLQIQEQINKEVELERNFYNKIKDLLSNGENIMKLDSLLNNIFSQIYSNPIFSENSSSNILKIFHTKNKCEMLEVALDVRNLTTFITLKLNGYFINPMRFGNLTGNFKEYFYLEGYVLNFRLNKVKDFSVPKYESLENEIYNYSLFLMKNRVMNLIYIFYKYHTLLLKIYDQTNISDLELLVMTAFDMFLNRIILHLIDIIMLYVKNTETIDNKTMSDISEIFCFNWTVHIFIVN